MLACCCFSRYSRLAALASECPLTRRRQMLDIGLGTGYLSSSAGAKQKRQDAKAIEELISDQVEHDPIKHLEILEYMASKFRTNHPTVEPAQQTLLALQVLEGVKDFLKTLKATDVMQGGVGALMGHGVEDVGGRVVWEHGEVIGMDADRVRVKYHSDKLRLWHRRFPAWITTGTSLSQ